MLRWILSRYVLVEHWLARDEQHGPLVKGPGPRLFGRWSVAPFPTKKNYNEFLAGVRRDLSRILERAAEDIQSSRERARSLLELKSTTALVTWTIVIGVVSLATLVTVLVTSL
jgi:hypothetical protein